MIVTEIKRQKKDPSRYSIYIDDAFAFGLVAEDVTYFKIKEGQPIAEETVAFIQKNVIYNKAQNSAFQYLSYKARTVKETRRKLSEKEFAEDVIEQVIQFLLKYKYLDDRKYCDSYIRESIRLKPKGKALLSYELQQRGVDRTTIEEALANSELDELEAAKRLLNKKIGSFADIDYKEKNKAFQFLARKGYSYAIIKEAFDACREDELKEEE